MMERTKLARERAKAVAKLAAKGLRAKEIGERLGYTKNAVVGICDRNGIQLTTLERWRAIRLQRIAAIQKMARDGLSAAEIGVHLGMSRPHVHNFARKEGISIPRTPRKRSTKRNANA
jgi:DNA-binding CsgD family transcriptional regulator